MGDIVNLRRARKDLRRRAAAKTADENRIAFGRTKAERKATAAERLIEERRLAGHLIEPAARTPGTDE